MRYKSTIQSKIFFQENPSTPEKKSKNIRTRTPFHPKVEIREHSLQADHFHILIVSPPKHSVSSMVGRIKVNTSREVREDFEQLRMIYGCNAYWFPGIFSSTVGVNEDVIRIYVHFQEKVDKEQPQLNFSFQVPRT